MQNNKISEDSPYENVCDSRLHTGLDEGHAIDTLIRFTSREGWDIPISPLSALYCSVFCPLHLHRPLDPIIPPTMQTRARTRAFDDERRALGCFPCGFPGSSSSTSDTAWLDS